MIANTMSERTADRIRETLEQAILTGEFEDGARAQARALGADPAAVAKLAKRSRRVSRAGGRARPKVSCFAAPPKRRAIA